ncbi:MAG: M48 family metallopeptidase [Nitrososphaerales archaeon]
MTLLASAFVYFDFFQDYFSSALVIFAIIAFVALLGSLFIFFKSSRNSVLRSRLLLGMMALSSSFWIFIISSLVLCVLFLQDYLASPLATILFVARVGFVISALTGPLAFFVLRDRAVHKIYGHFLGSANFISERGNSTESRIAKIFFSTAADVKLDMSLKLVVLKSNSSLPVSTAFDFKGTKIVAIKESVADLLEDDELETVLVHELAHIKNRDSLQKTLVTTFKMAFPFDPIIRFIEAAFYRERELVADEFAGLHTGKPASLASALLKIYEALAPVPLVHSSCLSSLSISNSSKLLNKQPPLELRIRHLLALAQSV